MKQMKEIYFLVAWIISLILGILACITLVGAVLGVPLLIASSKFKKARVMTDEQLIANRGSLLGWGIFVSIVLAPTVLGLVIALIFVIMVNKYISDLESGNIESTEKGFMETVKDSFAGKSKIEKEKEELLQLQKLKEEGFITEEEYEAKRKQILGL